MKSKTALLLDMLHKRWMTPLDMLRQCGLYSGPQRVSELRRSYVIRDMWVETPGGSRVKAYKCFGKISRG